MKRPPMNLFWSNIRPHPTVELKMMSFRRDLFTAITLLVALSSSCFALDDIPKRPLFERYAGMMNKSPFAVASVVTTVEKPNFAKDLYLANAAKLSDADMLTVQSAVDRGMKEYLTTRAPNDHGFAIVSIEWSERPAETKATISKDGQVATIGFNQALMAQAPPPMQPPNAGAPGQPTNPSYIPPRPNMPPGVPTPIPRVRGPIPRNPGHTARPASQ
jgi:hypothetical protein